MLLQRRNGSERHSDCSILVFLSVEKKRKNTGRKRECDAITKELFTGNRENIVCLNGRGIVIIFVEIPIMIAKIVYFIQSVPPVEFTCLLTIVFRHGKGELIVRNMRKDT